MDQPKTVVFGLDGAHFELLEPWLQAGELPNLRHAIETGVSGDLEAVLPPVTSPNWKAYLTGKNPGQFGIFWWENVDTQNMRIFYPSHRKNRETEFWEFLSETDDVGIMGIPTTHPPKQAGEIVLSGAPDGRNEGFAFPEELEEYLVREYDYKVIAKNELRATPEKAAEEILDIIDTRFEVAETLFDEKNLDFLQVTTFYINSLHHYFWDSDYTKRGWKKIDKHLGRFLDEGYDVVLMSDHGSNEIKTVFHINSWLEKEGYLELNAGAAKLVHRLGINRDRILRILSSLGLQNLANRLTPQVVLDLVPDEHGELSRESKTSNIDWEATDVIASGQGPIYLTIDEKSKEYDQLRTQLKKRLEGLKGPYGESVVSKVHQGEDVYAGEYLDDAPDLVLEQARNVHVQGGIGRPNVFSEPTADGWRGENKRNGLFVATGPSFGTGSVGGLSILDLAPTLLHLRGKEVPLDMDGEVKPEVFASGSRPGRTEPTYRETSTREKEIRRIRQAARNL